MIQIQWCEIIYCLMVKTENDLHINHTVGNANISRQENEIGEIIIKRNSLV